MSRSPQVLEALRLPELYRLVCLYAGIPLPPEPASGGRFVLRSGAESPELFTKLLEEAFVEDEAEVPVSHRGDPASALPAGPGRVAVQAGFDSACPVAEELRRAV